MDIFPPCRYSERSNTKCVGITIETRPDYCLKRHLSDMLGYGCTRLEIGVQSVYEDVARDTNRSAGKHGHSGAVWIHYPFSSEGLDVQTSPVKQYLLFPSCFQSSQPLSMVWIFFLLVISNPNPQAFLCLLLFLPEATQCGLYASLSTFRRMLALK